MKLDEESKNELATIEQFYSDIGDGKARIIIAGGLSDNENPVVLGIANKGKQGDVLYLLARMLNDLISEDVVDMGKLERVIIPFIKEKLQK